MVCMNCATGYSLDMDHPEIGDRLDILQVFRMETQHVDGKLQCSMNTETHHTGRYVTVRGSGEFIDGTELSCFPVEGIPCPYCSQTQLQFTFADPDRCPQCGEQSLRSCGLIA